MSSAKTTSSQAIHALYSDHHTWLLDWLRRRIGCAHNAADVAHDTFLRLIASRDALFGVREPRAFLVTTAKRLLIDRGRRMAIEQAYLAELLLIAETQTGYPAPEQILVALQALDQIAGILDNVSTKAREAFLLHYLDGFTHAETAERLSVSARMVRKYLVQVLVQCAALESDEVPA